MTDIDAAERLRAVLRLYPPNTQSIPLLDQALAAERRNTEAAWIEECARIKKAAEHATVERIRAAVLAQGLSAQDFNFDHKEIAAGAQVMDVVLAILDAEAER